MTDVSKSKLELITDLLKAILWPLIVIVVIIVFWKPIKGIIDQSDSITIGSLTLKLKNEIPTPSAPVRNVLDKISTQNIHELLFIGNDTSEYNGYSEKALEDSPVDEMINLKLIRSVERPSNGDTTKQYYKATALGAETYNFYIDLISAIGKQIDNPNKE